jgi:toxin FitB
MIVLDTNVLSEMMRASPCAEVVEWLAAQPSMSLYTTTITQAEILYGVGLLPAGRRRTQLASTVEAMFADDFAGRVLPFDSSAAVAFAKVAVDRRQSGRPISQHDAQIAAIARSRSAAVATRNVDDFSDCGLRVHNPWRGPA